MMGRRNRHAAAPSRRDEYRMVADEPTRELDCAFVVVVASTVALMAIIAVYGARAHNKQGAWDCPNMGKAGQYER